MRWTMLAVSLIATLAWGAPQDPIPYPSPSQAGFHHCALVYESPQRGIPELMPLVARVKDTKATEWLFDSYLFLIFCTPRGIGTSDGLTTQVDWQYQLDRWFSPGRDLAALDAAIDMAARDLGKPPTKRQIMLTIPYINPAVRDFGDTDGDGKTEDLSTPTGRSAVLRWYFGEARKRFASAGYHHLQLWGFYWMNEGVSPADEPSVREAARQIHVAKERFLWIPWYRAPGWEKWRALGFDVALMQPNYAFSATHKGQVRRNRLAITADLARSRGLGVEMEAGALLTNPADRRAFLQYLADGAPGRLGYQAAATAYYLSNTTAQEIHASTDPQVHALYDALADYVANRPVADPDQPIDWTTTPAGHLTGDHLASPTAIDSAETHFPAPRTIGTLDIFLDDPNQNAPWVGAITADILLPGQTTWSPAGWSVRTSADPTSGRRQVATLPINRTVTAIRLAFKPMAGTSSPLVRAIAPLDGADLPIRPHLALDKSYQFLPAPQATYPDPSSKLTDGVISHIGFTSGQMVGWANSRAAICFDLHRAMPIDRIEVHCQGGGVAGIKWPTFALAVTASDSPPPAGLSGLGSLPRDASWLLPGPLQIDRKRTVEDLDGHLTFRPPPGPVRYVNLLLQNDAWLMVSEVTIISAGQNVAPQSTYALRPPPTSNAAKGQYADDGQRLTDGIVAAEFTPSQVTGWDTDDPREVVLDLGTPQSLTTLTAWCLGGGFAGIYSPATIEAALSSDGATWRPAATATKPSEPEDGKQCHATPYSLQITPAQTAQYIKLRIKRDKGWAMISEIEVH